MSYNIHLPVFDGPFDLLLHLIDEQKVDIFDVSLSTITEGYLAYIDQLQERNINIGSDFLLMAATLLEMKSRLLLPARVAIDEKLVEELEKEKMAILNRLFEYKIYKNLAHELELKKEWFTRIYTPDNLPALELPPEEKELVFKNSSLDKLLSAFNAVWLRAKSAEARSIPREIIDETLTVADKIDEILYRLTNTETPKLEFSRIFSPTPTTFEVVVTFLAILELIRLKRITIEQQEIFGEILISSRQV